MLTLTYGTGILFYELRPETREGVDLKNILFTIPPFEWRLHAKPILFFLIYLVVVHTLMP